MAGAATVTSTTLIISPFLTTTTTTSPLSKPCPRRLSFSAPFRVFGPPSTICQAKNYSTGKVGDGIIDEGIFGGDAMVMEEEDDDVSDDDDDDTESSFDLLFRFLQSMFRKVSKRATKASRSVLPDAFPPELVSFAVDGVLLLASLSILKAFLEVICTLGGTVFVAILLLRVIWSVTSYFQSSGAGLDPSGSSYGRTQPVI